MMISAGWYKPYAKDQAPDYQQRHRVGPELRLPGRLKEIHCRTLERSADGKDRVEEVQPKGEPRSGKDVPPRP